ncbi:MAG: acetyltransferase [Actinobacteria bacterium]|nr:acetyltransferase [Actinomycetota bacterium]
MDTSKGKPLVILGGGGFAREVAWLVELINQRGEERFEIVGFLVHEDEGTRGEIRGAPLVKPHELTPYLPDLYAVVAIGNPRIRQRAISEAEELGCRFATLIHPETAYDRQSVTIGEGSIICWECTLTVDITIGRHVIINLDCTVGHDTVIEDCVTLSPGCHISGRNRIGKGVFMGAGAVTIEEISIGDHAIVGAGAVVNRDVPAGVTVVGVPAREKERRTK